MGVRKAISGLGFVRSELARQPRSDKSVRTRKVSPPVERGLPAEAGAARVVPVRGYFRRHWATILSYAFILLAMAIILGIGYTSYAFSRYQGLVLPGVYVDGVALGNQNQLQAQGTLLNRLRDLNEVPVEFKFHRHMWRPTAREVPYRQNVIATVRHAMSIGRSGNFWHQLIDRLPFRRRFNVTLISPTDRKLDTDINLWVAQTLVPDSHLRRPSINAGLVIKHGRVHVVRSQTGFCVNRTLAGADIRDARSLLHMEKLVVPLQHYTPSIQDAGAAGKANVINAFLAHPPTLSFGLRRVTLDGSVIASDIHFDRPARATCARPGGHVARLQMRVNFSRISSYIHRIAAGYFRPYRVAKVRFDGRAVTVISHAHDGRRMDADIAFHDVRHLMTHGGLRPGAHFRIPVHILKPPVQPNNPAGHGVTDLLGFGQSNFSGSPGIRVDDLRCIAAQFGPGILLSPGMQFSLNYYVSRGLGSPTCSGAASGSGWLSRVYRDSERKVAGVFQPSPGGAMQQMATTFFRGLYASGLRLVERHSHPYRLAWYQPPAGLDAVVSPNGEDLRFDNNSGGYVWIQVRVNETSDTLSVYVYGHHTAWTVNVSSPQLLRTYAPGPPIIQHDPSLAPGSRIIDEFPHMGANYSVTRTVVMPAAKPHGKPTRHKSILTTHYQPWREVIREGPPLHTPTPTPSPTPTASPTATAAPTAAPSPTPVG